MAHRAKAPLAGSAKLAAAMSAAPWLSILVPFGKASHLGGCLASISAQADAGVEVLLFADQAHANGVRKRWGREITTLPCPPHGSRGAAYNRMLDAARGEFVWLLDGRDRLTAHAVSELHGIVSRADPDLVLCDSTVLTPWIRPQYRRCSELRPTGFSGPGQITLADRSTLVCRLLGPEQLQPRSIISRRSLWSSLRFPEQHHCCERATLPRLALRAWTHHYAAACWVMHHLETPEDTLAAPAATDLSAALFEFTREFRQFRHASREARFLVSHACARNFIQAASQLAAGSEELIHCRRNFRRATLLAPGELLRRYLERGWREHWLHLSHWLNASCAAAKQQPEATAPPLPPRQEQGISYLR